MKVEVLKRYTVDGGDGRDIVAIVVVSWEDGESLQFACRNIFDFGYVINPKYKVAPGLEEGGMCREHNEEKWWWYFDCERGWYPVRPLTEHEKEALQYLYEHPPVYAGIRM
ncbi:hypothetical protein [Gelria sp. Kuro-4]|uniref:hypothetical protein n=1 Tax=Gelria sp. Kuro-4 TaxID=2796927 RepID=UPI001BEEDF6C|nr:hypothetical protein [Gelria sp. Kuro-4]BCV23261.1 hypothetical protein kuro4_00340 [Gelria sp. Kuro-4]